MAELCPGARSRVAIRRLGAGSLLCCSAFAGVTLARACDRDAVPVFSCEAAQGKKYIELCAPSPITADGGFLEYRFGAQNPDGTDASEELRFPTRREGSLQRFWGATFTSKGTYTQSVRFKAGPATYSVFTASRGHATVDAGVRVSDERSGRSQVVHCSERPRFAIHELRGLLACDPLTPVGLACIE